METSKWRQKLKLGERGHGNKCTFLALGDSVLNDLPSLRAWFLPLCTRQIHIHPKTSVCLFIYFFCSQLTLEIPAEKQLCLSFGQFFGLSSIFLWLFPMNSIYLLPPTFFFFFLPEENSLLISGPWQPSLIIQPSIPPETTLSSFIAIAWRRGACFGWWDVRYGDKTRKSVIEISPHAFLLLASVTKTRLQRVAPWSAWILEWLWEAETPGQPTMSLKCEQVIKHGSWNPKAWSLIGDCSVA